MWALRSKLRLGEVEDTAKDTAKKPAKAGSLARLSLSAFPRGKTVSQTSPFLDSSSSQQSSEWQNGRGRVGEQRGGKRHPLCSFCSKAPRYQWNSFCSGHRSQSSSCSQPPASSQTGPNLRALLLPDSSLAPMDLHGHQLQGEGSTLSALRSLVTKARVQASLTGTLISAGFWVENAAHSNFLTLATIPLWG